LSSRNNGGSFINKDRSLYDSRQNPTTMSMPNINFGNILAKKDGLNNSKEELEKKKKEIEK
jgi:hypothetical protein